MTSHNPKSSPTPKIHIRDKSLQCMDLEGKKTLAHSDFLEDAQTQRKAVFQKHEVSQLHCFSSPETERKQEVGGGGQAINLQRLSLEIHGLYYGSTFQIMYLGKTVLHLNHKK